MRADSGLGHGRAGQRRHAPTLLQRRHCTHSDFAESTAADGFWSRLQTRHPHSRGREANVYVIVEVHLSHKRKRRTPFCPFHPNLCHQERSEPVLQKPGIATLLVLSSLAGVMAASQVTLKLKEPNDDLAKSIALEHGFVVKGESFLDSHYFLHYIDSNMESEGRQELLNKLNAHPQVEWAKEEETRRRVKKVADEF